MGPGSMPQYYLLTNELDQLGHGDAVNLLLYGVYLVMELFNYK